MEKEEKQFTAGFNNGYLIAKYLPELYRKLRKTLTNSNAYVQGLFFGARQNGIEVEKGRVEDLRKIRRTKNHKRSLERD